MLAKTAVANRSVAVARRRYLPSGQIDILFIAEAPPADPCRFFYFESVDRHDALYLNLMRALFTDARDLKVIQLRADKSDYLLKFKEHRYYLLDATDEPMPARASLREKKSRLRASLERLIHRTTELATSRTRIVLISKSVYEVCNNPLRTAGLHVINQELIDFPASGRQGHFARKLRQDLQASDPDPKTKGRYPNGD